MARSSADAQDQCMHCADPGCLAACPADGAIVKYANASSTSTRKTASAVNSAFPAALSRFRVQPNDEESLQVHALLRSRRRRA